MRSRVAGAVVVLSALGAACSAHAFHPPPEEENIARADSLYSPAAFDSIEWASRQERIEAGNLVFATECRRCHGAIGRGETDYAAERELEVPSLVEEDWEYAGHIQDVRRVIFTGHVGGMPDWGPDQLAARDIDAVAFYILEQLRPEVLEDSIAVDLPLD